MNISLGEHMHWEWNCWIIACVYTIVTTAQILTRILKVHTIFLCGLLGKLQNITDFQEKRMRRGRQSRGTCPRLPMGLFVFNPPRTPWPHDLPFPSTLPNKGPSFNPTTLPGRHWITYLFTGWPWSGF